MNIAIAGIFLFLILYYYLKYGDREVWCNLLRN
jgi:hypothetical protein